MAAIPLTDLTSGTVEGSGVFDELMKATRAHLEQEYKLGRIKAPEYSTVYLGALQTAMNQSIQFLLSKQKADLEAQLIAQQLTNLVTDNQKTVKELDLLDAQISYQAQEELRAVAQTSLITQQAANAVTENTVLVAQECKLKAEFDQLVELKLKTVAEVSLINQKRVTEQAQTSGTGVDADSVIGKQKGLYQAQTDGFARDAEQKTAKLMVDSWNVRRTTDDATVADATNKLDDASIGRAVEKLLAGINA